MATANRKASATRETSINEVFTVRTPHKEGNNPCICVVRDTASDEAGVWAFITEACTGHTKKSFAQGHDARYKSNLIAANRAGMKVKITNAKTGATFTALPLEWAALREWERFLTEGAANKKALAKLNGEQG